MDYNNFIHIDDPAKQEELIQKYTTNYGMVPAKKFNSKDKIVDQLGKKIESESTYEGRKYKLIAKRDHLITPGERHWNRFLGVLACIFSVCLALFSPKVRRLFSSKDFTMHFAVWINPPVQQQAPQQSAAQQPTGQHSSAASSQRTEAIAPPETPPVISMKISEQQLKDLDAEDITSKNELAQGIDIPEGAKESLQYALMNPRKKEGAAERGIKWYNSGPRTHVFALDAAPGLIFKTQPRSIVKSFSHRYENMLKAKSVCRKNDLNLLVIPNAKMYSVAISESSRRGVNEMTTPLIVEKKLNLHPSQSMQDQLYSESTHLDESFKQLTTFACLTGYNDAETRNNCILDNDFDEHGNQRLGLVDLDNMGHDPDDSWSSNDLKEYAAVGLFGLSFPRRNGIIHCVNNEQQAKMILEIANKHGINTKGDDVVGIGSIYSYEAAWKMRQEAIEENNNLKKFYANKAIKVGNELLPVNQQLDFSAYPQQEKLQAIAQALFKEINKQITKSDEPTIKSKRWVYIPTDKRDSHPEFHNTDKESITGAQVNESEPDWNKRYEDYYLTSAFGVVAQKFKELGLIFNVKREYSGWILQA